MEELNKQTEDIENKENELKIIFDKVKKIGKEIKENGYEDITGGNSVSHINSEGENIKIRYYDQGGAGGCELSIKKSKDYVVITINKNGDIVCRIRETKNNNQAKEGNLEEFYQYVNNELLPSIQTEINIIKEENIHKDLQKIKSLEEQERQDYDKILDDYFGEEKNEQQEDNEQQEAFILTMDNIKNIILPEGIQYNDLSSIEKIDEDGDKYITFNGINARFYKVGGSKSNGLCYSNEDSSELTIGKHINGKLEGIGVKIMEYNRFEGFFKEGVQDRDINIMNTYNYRKGSFLEQRGEKMSFKDLNTQKKIEFLAKEGKLTFKEGECHFDIMMDEISFNNNKLSRRLKKGIINTPQNMIFLYDIINKFSGKKVNFRIEDSNLIEENSNSKMQIIYTFVVDHEEDFIKRLNNTIPTMK